MITKLRHDGPKICGTGIRQREGGSWALTIVHANGWHLDWVKPPKKPYLRRLYVGPILFEWYWLTEERS